MHIYTQDEVNAGIREMRLYVEGAGFEWCEDESAVFNVTTALGLLRGTIGNLNENYGALQLKYALASAELVVEKTTNGLLIDALKFVKEECESLPDRPEQGNTRIWTETVNSVYGTVRDTLDLHKPKEVTE